MQSTTIAETVRNRRRQLGLSQTLAARYAGISRRAWSEIELGHRHGSPETLLKMDVALQQPPGSLAAIEAKSTDPELEVMRRELLDIINSLTTREELEQAGRDLIRGRIAALTSQLDRYERPSRVHDEPRPADDDGGERP